MTSKQIIYCKKHKAILFGVKKGIVDSEVSDLSGNRKQEQKVPQKAVIGIGAGKSYTLYDVGIDNTQFVQAGYQSEKMIKGFG